MGEKRTLNFVRKWHITENNPRSLNSGYLNPLWGFGDQLLSVFRLKVFNINCGVENGEYCKSQMKKYTFKRK